MPVGCYLVDPSTEVELRSYLLEIGMASLVPIKNVACRPDGRYILAGMFGVPHKDGMRMIFDRRPANWGEKRLGWAHLPNGVQFAQLRLKPGWGIRGSGDDLKGYFHQVRDVPEAQSRNCFGRTFLGDEFVSFGGIPGESYKLCLNSVAMGNLNAVDICQRVHEAVLQNGGLLKKDTMIRYPYEMPAEGIGEGIYIDDHLVFWIAPQSQLSLPYGPDKDIILTSHKLYEQANLQLSLSKGFGFADRSSDVPVGDQSFVAWGTRVDSDLGRVGVEPSKRQTIAFLLFCVLSQPRVPVTILKRVVALCIHPLLHRRELMCFLHRFFNWLSHVKGSRARLPSDIKEELLVVALHLSVARADVRAPVCTRISATDATPQRGGSVETTCSSELADALYDSCEVRGRRVRLDRSPFSIIPEHEELPVPDPIVADVANCAPWSVTRNHDFPETQHINLQELSEVLNEVKHASVLCQQAERLVNICDSRVTVGAWARGRSSSTLVNGILREATCWRVLARKTLGNVFAKSGDNPSDDPSRDVPLRPPRQAPSWLDPRLRPEKSFVNKVRRLPKRMRLCKEAFAGRAGLSLALKAAGLQVGRPLEAYPSKGVYVRESDLLVKEVFDGLVRDIKAGLLIYIAFGTPCSSWSILARRKNSRTYDCPQGLEVDARELLANKQAVVTAELCQLLANYGSYFSIENPKTSLLFRYEPIERLLEVKDASLVSFDQCAYGLRLPGTAQSQFCKKATSILSNIPAMTCLSRKCPGLGLGHEHVHAQGSVRVNGKSIRASTAAGVYPDQLCKAWAQAVHSALYSS